MERGQPGAGAGDSARLRGGGLGLPAHQHLRRLPHHAGAPLVRRPGSGDQRPWRGRRARRVRCQGGLRDRRHWTVRGADGAVWRHSSGRGARRLSRTGRGAGRRRRRRHHGRDADLAGGDRPRHRRRQGGGRAVRDRLHGIRPEPQRQGRAHHDGRQGGAGRRGIAGGGRRHPGDQLRYRHRHDLGGAHSAALPLGFRPAADGEAEQRPAGTDRHASGLPADAGRDAGRAR